MGHSVASLYLAAIYHFSIGSVRRNIPRAIHFYNLALKDQDNLEYQLKVCAKAMLYLAEKGIYMHSSLFDISTNILTFGVKAIYGV